VVLASGVVAVAVRAGGGWVGDAGCLSGGCDHAAARVEVVPESG